VIRHLKYKNINELIELWLFLKFHVHPDFYLTQDNKRVFITEFKILKKLLEQSHEILISSDNGNIDGIILIWYGVAKDTKRKYIKINAKNEKIALKLLTVLLWNYLNSDLFIKINKQSSFIQVFRNKNFNFLGGRGREILLRHSKNNK